MASYVFTTNNNTIVIVGVGATAEDAKANATQAAQALNNNVELVGQTEFNHSVVINLAITLLNKAKSDDVLMQKLFQRFGERAKFEVRNDVNEDGSVRKHFYINGVDRVHLDLKNKTQVDSYEDKGLSEEHTNAIFNRLEHFVAKDEIIISSDGDEPPVIPVISEPVDDTQPD